MNQDCSIPQVGNDERSKTLLILTLIGGELTQLILQSVGARGS